MRQSTESEVTVCLTPEVKGKTFQERGVFNRAITAGDQRKVTSNQTKPGLGVKLGGCGGVHLGYIWPRVLIFSTAKENKNQTKVKKASSSKVSGPMCTAAVWVNLEGCGPSKQAPGVGPRDPVSRNRVG